MGPGLRRDDTESLAATTAPSEWRQREALRLPHHRLQIIIRLDDLDQAIFGGAVAAIGVGVVLLHQRLVLGLDVGERRTWAEAHDLERFALGVHDLAGF